MQNDGNRWDPATVIGLNNLDRVLVYGNPAFMPWLSQVCKNITAVRRPNELKQLAKNGDKFDKIIIAREATFEPELVLLSGPLLDEVTGLFIVLPSDDGWSARTATDFYYPEADAREVDSTFGVVHMAALKGVSWRVHHDA